MPDHWFEPVAEHLGSAYLRYSFTRGTANEVDFLVQQLELGPGDRVLDVGCGPGRHALALGERGIEVLGADISQRFVDLGNEAVRSHDDEVPVRFERIDARALPFDGEFDAVISLCQGAFGLAAGGPAVRDGAGGPAVRDGAGGPAVRDGSRGVEATTAVDPDGVVLDGMARALRPGGRLAVSAFSAYFQLRYLEDADTFDADAGVNHERTTVRDEAGVEAEVDLWTTCFTPRELRLLAGRAGLVVDHVYSVTPGAYEAAAPTIETPELLLVAHR